MRKHVMWWALVVIVCGAVQALPASAAPQEEPPPSYARGFTRKLGRGVANVVTSPLELIRVPTLTARKDGGLAGLTVGLARGAWAGVERLAAGAVEIVTFPVPFPSGWDSLVRPEFMYAHGEWVE